MAIENLMYIQKANRLSLNKIAPSVTTVRAGQHFHLDDNGEWVYADGTRKSYPTLNNRFQGAGLGSQGERLEGLDDVSKAGKLSVLAGNYEIGTDQFDATKTYTYGAALKVTANGQVTLFVALDKPEFIAGYVTGVPAEAGDFLRYQA
jgi:hypothetical protein